MNSITPKTAHHNDNNKLSHKSGKPKVSCFNCSGQGHVKQFCNWNGTGESQPETHCQLGEQMGHAAPSA